jgi:hypothetical protein
MYVSQLSNVDFLCVKTCFNVKEYVKHSAKFPSVFWIAPHICEYPSWKEELGSYTYLKA